MGLFNNRTEVFTIDNGWVHFWTVNPTTGAISPGEKIKVENFFSDARLTTQGISNWQALIKQAISTDALRNLDGSNPQSQTSANGTYSTTASTTNLPATNKEGILEVRNQGTKKYFRYFTYNVGRIEIWTQHFDGSAWSVWNYANGESSLAFTAGVEESGGVVKLGGILDSERIIDLSTFNLGITGKGEFFVETEDDPFSHASKFYVSHTNVRAEHQGPTETVETAWNDNGIVNSHYPRTTKRNTLPGNDTQNAAKNTVYITDASTLNMPATTKVGILESFDHNDSGDIELRYTTYTSGVIEIWGRKKSGVSWFDWVKLEETANTILTKIGDGSQIASQYLPSYVDDVIDSHIVGATPLASDWLSGTDAGAALTPEQGKIYTIVTAGEYQNNTYRWSGSAYVSLSNPLDYVTQPESETSNPTENTKVTTILRVFQGFVYWVENVGFAALNTSSKNLIGAINELLANSNTDFQSWAISAINQDIEAYENVNVSSIFVKENCTIDNNSFIVGFSVAPTGSAITVNMYLNGVSIFTIPITIDADEQTNLTAATAYALTSSQISLTKGDEITTRITAVGAGTPGKTGSAYMIYTKA